jgi:hypothetical protein
VGGFSVVYDGVIGPWFLDTFITTAGLTEVDDAVLLPTVEACQQRVEARHGHGFTDLAATASMHRQFSEAELEQRHLIREQGLSPGESADLIREALSSGTRRHSITLAVHNAPRYAHERAAVVP